MDVHLFRNSSSGKSGFVLFLLLLSEDNMWLKVDLQKLFRTERIHKSLVNFDFFLILSAEFR